MNAKTLTRYGLELLKLIEIDIDCEVNPIGIVSKVDDGLNDGLKSSKRGEQIISMLKVNPEVNIDEIAKVLCVSKPTVERDIATLKANGTIERIGSKKSGKWVIVR